MSRRLAAAAFVAALAIFASLEPSSRPITGDNQLYFFMAERAASGAAPHVSHVDTKQQLGTLVTAAAIAGGRIVGLDDVAATRAASMAAGAAAVALASMLAWQFAAALWPRVPAGCGVAAVVAAVGLVTARGFADHAATGANVKIFLAAFVLAAHLAMTGRRRACDIAAGLSGGAAFLAWQPALLVPVALVAEALAAGDEPLGRRCARAASILAAAIAAFAAYELWFLLAGALGEQLRQTFVLPLGSVHPAPDLLGSLRFVAAQGRGSPWPPRLLPLGAAAACLVLVARPAWSAAALRCTPGLLSFCLAAAGATAFTLYDHQGVPDLFLPYPYFAVATGLLVAAAAAARGRSLAMAGRAAAGLCILVLLSSFAAGSGRAAPAFSLADQRRLAGELREWSAGASIYAYGAVHLLGLAHLDNHVPYGLYFDDLVGEIPFENYRPLRRGRMPDIVLVSRGEAPGSRSWLASEYDDRTPAGFAEQGIAVHRRREP